MLIPEKLLCASDAGETTGSVCGGARHVGWREMTLENLMTRTFLASEEEKAHARETCYTTSIFRELEKCPL